jgi:hypothetical protein
MPKTEMKASNCGRMVADRNRNLELAEFSAISLVLRLFPPTRVGHDVKIEIRGNAKV